MTGTNEPAKLEEAKKIFEQLLAHVSSFYGFNKNWYVVTAEP